jgi:DNA-binding transcriptional MerR regulator
MAEYKIKDVEVLTGIKAHTIRIWEKRYGILIPDRTASKIRTYSESDLVHLLNISILNQNGIKISKISKLSFDEVKEEVKKINFSSGSESAVLSLLIGALIDFDEPLFKRVFMSVINKEGLKSGYFNYILPFLDRIGIMWLVGTITPPQEHFISNLIREIIIVETSKLPESKKERGYVLFCREGDWHELSLLFYNYLLREKGEKTYYLGQNLPLQELSASSNKIQVEAFVSSLIAPLNEKSTEDFILCAQSLKQSFYIGGAQSKSLFDLPQAKTIFKDVKELFV